MREKQPHDKHTRLSYSYVCVCAARVATVCVFCYRRISSRRLSRFSSPPPTERRASVIDASESETPRLPLPVLARISTPARKERFAIFALTSSGK